MAPRFKLALLIFALQVPYLAFAIYFGLQFPRGQAPVWYTDTLLAWFGTNFLIAVFAGKRLLRTSVVQSDETGSIRVASSKAAARLIIVWVALFLYGAKATVQGKIPLARAVPAGAFLLFFIGMFAWGAYRMRREHI
jgi:hypothetical protein